MVQYHALGLLHHLRKRDPLAIEKLVQKLARSGLKSPLAATLLIRIAAQVKFIMLYNFVCYII